MGWSGSLSGLFYIGSGFMLILQMVLALLVSVPDVSIIITIIFAIIPILLGVAIIRLALKNLKFITKKSRILFIIIGIAGLFVWSGLYIGPSLAIISGLLPNATNGQENISK